jgi:hypothetical protein
MRVLLSFSFYTIALFYSLVFIIDAEEMPNKIMIVTEDLETVEFTIHRSKYSLL